MVLKSRRLDFVSFSISQPAASTVCATDTFQVGGASSTVPTICGDNSDQHSTKFKLTIENYIGLPFTARQILHILIKFLTKYEKSAKLQHAICIYIVYIEVPSSATSPTDLQLLFNFGAASTVRSWNIKIAMLPCSASYLGKDAMRFDFVTS